MFVLFSIILSAVFSSIKILVVWCFLQRSANDHQSFTAADAGARPAPLLAQRAVPQALPRGLRAGQDQQGHQDVRGEELGNSGIHREICFKYFYNSIS